MRGLGEVTLEHERADFLQQLDDDKGLLLTFLCQGFLHILEALDLHAVDLIHHALCIDGEVCVHFICEHCGQQHGLRALDVELVGEVVVEKIVRGGIADLMGVDEIAIHRLEDKAGINEVTRTLIVL